MVFKNRFIIYFIVLAIECLPFAGFAQNGAVYIDPNIGEKKFRKEQVMDANRAQSIFGNWGMFGKRDDPLSGVWPKGTGHGHVHEMTMLVCAEVLGKDGQIYQIASDSYSESPDRAPDGTEYWWNPLPGYANEDRYVVNASGLVDSTSKVAVSTDESTWPAIWPGKDATWDGTWNGYFGKDQFSADKEGIYVIDDFANSEFPYYPVASDSTKRGLGMQVETRLFQWAHPLAQDQIFIHFQVTNISDNTYDRNVFLGAFADTHPGGLGSSNDMNGYSNEHNMVFAWAKDNIGIWSTFRDILPGYMAWKYLESPGQIDGIDNDNDGLIDEERDDLAGDWIEGPVGIYGEPKWHWSGDEDGDWDPDVDDVGSDGIGPLDLNWVAPDFDGSEGNGKPDQGEPNFGKTDNDESDQIGLTSFYAPSYGALTSSNDASIWQFIQPGNFEKPEDENNRLWIFASGPFILNRNQTERFSVCWLFGADEKEIFRNAYTSQQIYDNDYRFTKPPLTPTLKAVAGDDKVTLYWDNIAEKSLDPVYGRDFEGYRIYKSTDPQLTDAQLITNAYGNFAYYKPIAQFDLVDGIKDLHPVALGQELGNQYSTGIHYDMGTDSGLRYYYEDTDVINGVTYYYVVVSYDQGYYEGMDDRNLVRMSPAECAFEITYQYGALSTISQNAAIVTPGSEAVDYVPGHTNADENGYINKSEDSPTTGQVQVVVVDPSVLVEDENYEVTFVDELNELGEILTGKYSVMNTTTGEILIDEEAVPTDSITLSTLKWSTTIFDGMQLNFENTVPDPIKVNALSGFTDDSETNFSTTVYYGGSGLVAMNFIIEITEQPAHFPFKKDEAVYLKVYDKYTLDTLDFQISRDQNRDGKLNDGDVVTVLQETSDERYIRAWRIAFQAPGDENIEAIDPQPGDKFVFNCDMPFTSKDKFTFTTTASNTETVAKESLNKVAVVPNPYLLTASWERGSDISGRGERKVSFIHLPSDCKIRIFTQNGILIKTIDHSGNFADGNEFWDLTTDEGLEVAFGIYVFHIEAPGIGQKVGTFAIIN